MEKINSIVKMDVVGTREMIDKSYYESRFTKYDRVYFETNEDCDKLLSKIDVVDKKILTVLGSGDQAFHFYLNGAKHVDLFDVNKLTMYYYYLRIWNIKKNRTMYPNWHFDREFVKDLLSSVKPNSRQEAIAYRYWTEIVTKFDSNFLHQLYHAPNYKNLYENADINFLLERVEEDNFMFYDKDISLVFDIPKKYDIIYTSNIGDYIEKDSLILYRNNLYNHLNSGGIVLSSNLSHNLHYSILIYQKRVMDKYFKFNEISLRYEDNLMNDIGYYYKKRRIKKIF